MGVTLLYVDDEDLNLKVFELSFRKKYNVITASSGEEGLSKLEGNTDIIVVISDMKMPQLNGVEFIKKAKSIHSNISYFILTGYDINDEIEDALNKNLILRYFTKPFNRKEIDDEIQKAITNV